MDKIYVVFWTQGGNTQAMAEAIGEGIREAGKEAEVVFVTGADMEAAGATVLNGEGLICHETPDEDGLNACRELGRQLADA